MQKPVTKKCKQRSCIRQITWQRIMRFSYCIISKQKCFGVKSESKSSANVHFVRTGKSLSRLGNKLDALQSEQRVSPFLRD